MDCIFCKIVNGEIPAQKIYEDDKIIAFNDVNPAAPVHILLIPKEHISSIMELQPDDAEIISHIFLTAKKIAQEVGISDNGFRIVNNCGEEGGQTVKHLHFHLIGGRAMGWPPG